MNLDPQGAVINPSIVRGETFALHLIYEAGDPLAAVNLAGYKAKMMLRQVFDGEPLVTLTESAGIALGGAAGSIIATLTAAQSKSLPIGKVVYDLALTSPAGVVMFVARGVITVIRNVTGGLAPWTP